MSEPYTNDRALEAIKEFFVANCPRLCLLGTPEHHADRLVSYGRSMSSVVCVRWESAFGVGCTMHFGLYDEPSVSWGGMDRSLLAASASVALYKQVIDFAIQLEVKRQEELRYVRESEKRRSK